MPDLASLVDARHRLAREEMGELGIVWPAADGSAPRGDRAVGRERVPQDQLPEAARRFAFELAAAERGLGLFEWWAAWLTSVGSHPTADPRGALRAASVTTVDRAAGASIDAALRRDLADLVDVAVEVAGRRAALEHDHHLTRSGVGAVLTTLEVFLDDTRDAYEGVVGRGVCPRRAAEVYARLAADGRACALSQSSALALVVGDRSVSSWLDGSTSTVHRGRCGGASSVARFPLRGTDILLGPHTGVRAGLELLHEVAHAIHHDLLFRFEPAGRAAFPDALWMETWAHLVEHLGGVGVAGHVARRSLVLARVHAVRALYGWLALDRGRTPGELDALLRELYGHHLGAAPPPCDVVTDLFGAQQNLLRAQALAAAAVLGSAPDVAPAGKSPSELFAAMLHWAVGLDGTSLSMLADGTAAEVLGRAVRAGSAA